jgi:hypothetical protein
MDLISAHAAALAGLFVPFLTALVRQHVLKVDGKAAQILSLVVAGGAVALAQYATGHPITVPELMQDGTMAWSIAQVLRTQLRGVPVVEKLAGR